MVNNGIFSIIIILLVYIHKEYKLGRLQPHAQRRLMLGGAGDRGLGVEDDPTKAQLTVQEEVELLVHQEP